MTNDIQNLIHKVIDDLATAEERQTLAKIVLKDETAATEFEQLKQLSAMLASVPALAAPPELHAAVMSQIKNNNTSQLILEPSVFVASAIQNQNQKSASTSQIFFSRMETVMSEIKKGFFSSTMNKALVGGGVAAAALIAITAGGNFPATNQDTVGTIAPAQRYRSDQSVTANVQPSANGGAGSAQVSVNTDNAAANSASNAANRSAAKGAVNSADKAAMEAADKAASKGAVNSADKAAMEAADKAASRAASKGAVNSADKAAMEAADKAASRAASKGAVNSADKAAMEAADKAASRAASKGAVNSADKAAMEAADKAAAKAANKLAN